MSMYNPIWDTLKITQVASLVANRNLHARIIKAVTKRKWLDLGYKMSIEPKVALMSHTRKGNTLTFYINIAYTKHIRYDTKGKIIL